MIRHLAESMPGVRIDTVEMDETTVEPLDAVLAQLPTEGTGPVMVIGLEKAVSSTEPEHPVLFHLNLSRPEWPRKVPRPVVLWVPEYVLGFLGREAPDFLDWRSDTLHFPEPAEQDLRLFDSKIWQGGQDGRMPEPERRARIAELRARLAQSTDTEDPGTLATYSDWMSELGYHHFLFGELEEAEQVLKGSLSVEEKLNRPDKRMALYYKLGEVYQALGRLADSKQFLITAIDLGKLTNDDQKLLASHALLASVLTREGDLPQSMEVMKSFDHLLGKTATDVAPALQPPRASFILDRLDESISILESLGHLDAIARLSLVAGSEWAERGDLERAEAAANRALVADKELGYLARVADDYHLFGRIYRKRGELERAEQAFRQAVEIGEQLSASPILADSLKDLGSLLRQRGENDKALEAWTRAGDLYAKMGDNLGLRIIQSQLDSLTDSLPASDKEQPPSN
jgi:tetratricopeptide (TPR) repeat protein